MNTQAANTQAAKLAHWLLAGNGALKNVAQLATEAFAPAAVAAITVDTTTITAYPVNPTAEPTGDDWTHTSDGWVHPLHSQLLPRAASADHHVVVGVTSRNELLIANLAAAGYLGIEGTDPIPLMRSWMLQTLTKTPDAHVAVTDPELAIPTADRLTVHATIDEVVPSATLVFTTGHTSAPTTPTPAVVSSQAADAANTILCNGDVAGIYLADRYWPLWRRIELDDTRWATMKSALAPPPAPAEPAPTPAPDRHAGSEDQRLAPAADEPPPAPTPPAEPEPHPSVILPGTPPPAEPRVGLYALGKTYVLGVDPETGDPVRHSAITRQGPRKPVKALMAVATSGGLTMAEWEESILQVTPSNRRQLRVQIRKMMAGQDPVRINERGLLVVTTYCDWKEFKELVGHNPATATDENLTAAVTLIRGAPFADIPDEDYSWRAVQLLKDELIDLCASAALELAQRQRGSGATNLAYETARLGLQVYSQREDLWAIAAATAPDADRPGLAWDLKQALPSPGHPELRELLATSRAS